MLEAVALVSVWGLVLGVACEAQARDAAVAPTADARPRIGLVLSGGGARGAAHIGVLKVLQELRVPVHCIAGTSMGAVIGGAYAAGNSPAQMRALIEATDWGEVFSDRPPRSEIAVRRKLDEYKPLFAPEFGVNQGGLQLPRGVVAGVTIEGFLRRLAAPASGETQFDSLGVPYRAVAADITSGEAVVLGSGSLMQAMRASMAVPGAVAPVEIDGRLLVDGGIANNLPISVARDMCADVLIAVNISTPVLKRSEITSAVSIVGQLINLLGKESVDRQLASLAPADVLITPDLGDISAGSFERQLEAIAVGEAAARQAEAALRRYSVSESEYAMFLAARDRAIDELGTVQAIRFEGLQRTNAEVLQGLLNAAPGQPLDMVQLNADLRRVYGRGDFDAVDFRLDNAAGQRALVIPVREKETGPNYLRFGLGLSSDFHGDAQFNVLLSHRRTWINSYGGEWLTEAQIGRTNYLFTEFYQPIDRGGRLFVAPYALGGRSTAPSYIGDRRVSEYEVNERRIGVDLGGELGTWGEWRVGPLWRHLNGRLATGERNDVGDGRFQGSAVRLHVVGDTYDTAWFPRNGHRLALSGMVGRGDGLDAAYRRVEAYWSGAASRGDHTVGVTVRGGSGLNTRLPVTEGFDLGGPLRLSGYRAGQFSGERMAYGMVRYYNRLQRLPSLLGSGVYAGAALEAGRVDRQFQGGGSTGMLWSASLFLSAETFLGPAYLGVGVGPNGNRSLYLLLGVAGL